MIKSFYLIFIAILCPLHAIDPLPSWNEGIAKQKLLEFVKMTTEEGSGFIPPEERIATFDQDGTLWVEQPFYAQGTFALERIHALASQHPEWKHQAPFQAILERDQEAIKNFTEQDIGKILAVSHSGMSIKEYHQLVHDWLKEALHPRFKRPYTELAYQPMLEVLKFLREKGFKTYIVTGGGQEFVRTYGDQVYGIPTEHIIGTAGKVRYEIVNDQPVLTKIPDVFFIDDKQGKPEGINLFIGKRPVAAFGNSIGDQQMLEWSKGLALLVHHDDAEREYAYDEDSKIGRFSAELMRQARAKGWIVVSMKQDWNTLFAP